MSGQDYKRCINAMDHSVPALSVVVSVYNKAETIESCLKAVRASLYANYELIVIDDGSTDNSLIMAKQYADTVISNAKRRGRIKARDCGLKTARANTVVFVDADVVVRPDSLFKIADFFQTNPYRAALTGRLAIETPQGGFWSRYKNLYMNYIFGLLPDKVTFLYGSIYALQKKLIPSDSLMVAYSGIEDTEMGHNLAAAGQEISFLPSLEVVHLKKYTAFSLLKNDFRVPLLWTRLMLTRHSRPSFTGKGPVFAHASKEQLAAIGTIGLIGISLAAHLFGLVSALIPGLLFLLWLGCNNRFFRFIFKNSNLLFTSKAALFTLLDQFMMGLGICCGLLSYRKLPARTP